MNDLTVDEAYAIAAFISIYLIKVIKNDTGIDSMKWLRGIIHGYEKLCKFSGYVGYTEDEEEKK